MLLENTSAVFKKMSHAAMRAGRRPEDVRLVAVSKTVDINVIKQACDVGLRAFGENKVQEAQSKVSRLRSEMPDIKVEWHMIGHLQRNKARVAVGLFELIHSLDSEALAADLDKAAGSLGKIQRVLIQVKLSEEETKSGIAEQKLESLAGKIADLRNLKLEGLMTMPPYFDNPELSRPYFRRLRELRDGLSNKGYALPELSMGMSHDFEIAIQEGATLVRVGTAIFGERRVA
ncbi:MAG TPA: YggS family pyridoxal phosphate-dependent enzyme [Dissulfurispiraceae bacterium]|nr:YggS family pyridoxal phosphate-dependent enzyme [Dissulfurispiraceae bacterium]